MAPNLSLALAQVQSARDYMLAMLADIPDDDWFRMPDGWPTHIGWQVAHLAMAEYGLCLYRQRGRGEGDTLLMPSSFRKRFGRGTRPEPDPAKNPTPAEIRATLERVRAQVQLEAPTFTAAQLSEPVDMPFAGSATRLGAILFCAHHEMLHAGQIGALRRCLGKEPVR